VSFAASPSPEKERAKRTEQFLRDERRSKVSRASTDSLYVSPHSSSISDFELVAEQQTDDWLLLYQYSTSLIDNDDKTKNHAVQLLVVQFCFGLDKVKNKK
jgi:hypothetical protein